MRLTSYFVAGLLSVAACSAGSIEIGGTNGLTATYIASGCSGAGPCAPGSAGSFAEKNYDVKLFTSAENGSSMATPYPTYNQTAAEAGTLSSPFATFAMINDSVTGGNSENFWNGQAATTITVPVGINNVTDVATMLSNVYGLAGEDMTVVTFDFGTTSNASSYNDVVVVDLQNAGALGSTPSGQIGTAIDCTTAGTFSVSNPCNSTFAVGALAASSTPTTTLNGNPVTLTVNAANIATGLFGVNGNAYTSVAAGVFAGTTGNISLDAQDFLLGNLVAPSAGEYLVNIKVQELNGLAGTSNTALSAITVDTTPEPSTILLFMTGLGALGLARFRRKA
jgi:hypothetical protein